jgi:hypothetical protein
VNGFFTHLAYACRTYGNARLSEWWSEARSAREWGNLVRPDGVGAVSFGSGKTRFFLEVDRGTEATNRLGEKLGAYARIARLEGVPRIVLFTFPSARREAEVRRALTLLGLAVATSTRDRVAGDPLGEVWLPLWA